MYGFSRNAVYQLPLKIQCDMSLVFPSSSVRMFVACTKLIPGRISYKHGISANRSFSIPLVKISLAALLFKTAAAPRRGCMDRKLARRKPCEIILETCVASRLRNEMDDFSTAAF